MATNGRTIIEAALDLCNYVVRHPDNSKWFDAGGATGSTDDRINSTHKVEYDEVKPKTVIDEIAEKASNPAGVKGFDLYETPSGCLIGHLRNSLDFVSPIASITPENYEMSTDVHRVRNKIIVYGAGEKRLPSDGDSWTESTTDWYSNGGTISADTSVKQVGNASIKITGILMPMLRYNPSGTWNSSFMREAFKKIHFWIRLSVADAGLSVRLKTSALNYFYYNFGGLPADEWREFILPIGPKNEFTAGWSKVGAPDWASIDEIEFYAGITAGAAMWIDGLFLDEAHFKGTAEDATSQGSYGVRVQEPVVDEALKSDAECLAKAEALVAFYKDPVISLENVLVDGDHRYVLGDRLRVIVANDSLDAYFRILEVKHVVRGVNWDSILTLSNEPVLIEQLLRTIVEQRNVDARRN